MKVKGLSHITFICKDLAKTSRMLQEVFGAEEIYHSGDKTFSLSKEKFFNLSGIWIAIMEGEPVARTYNHVAFAVSEADLPLLEARIVALGLDILPGRKREQAEGQSLDLFRNIAFCFESKAH